MWIYLLRHGVAEEPRAGLTDEQRALTEEGMEKLRRASPAWRRLVHTPSVVMCSPLVRARRFKPQAKWFTKSRTATVRMSRV